MSQRPHQRSEPRIEILIRRARKYVHEERTARALRILELAEKLQMDTGLQFRIHMLQAECLLASRNFAALESLVPKLQYLVDGSENLVQVRLLDAHWRALAGRSREAVRLVVRASREHTLGAQTRAHALRVVGIACYRSGHYGWSQTCFQLAASFYRLGGQHLDLIRCLSSLSLVARSKGKSALALDYLDEAVQFLPRRGHRKIRARLLINRGICLLKLGKLTDARTMFMEARSITAERIDTAYQVMVLNNLGHVYRLQGNYETALEFHEQALKLAREAHSDRQIGLSLEFLGETNVEASRAAKALEYLNEAYDIAQRLTPQGDLMMEVLRRRGEARVVLGDSRGASEDLEKAIRLCSSRGERREAALARRAYGLHVTDVAEDLERCIHNVLDELDRMEDRFEFARTVYLVLKDGRLDPAQLEWLADARVAATHYLTTLGSNVWRQRLQDVSGARRPMTTRQAGADPLGGYFLASRSPVFACALEAVRVAARSPLPALILGETGVGKEVVARLLHQSSSRSAGPLTAINCGALPESLIESELFGHALGAYTGAGKEKPGLLEASDRGTVLLDEIGDLPAPAQVKLLRFLDTGEVRRVGEVRARRCDVRVLASTNHDIESLVRVGRFRADLLYRLKAFRIQVPALRERPEDILDLARSFLRAAAPGGPQQTLSPELEGWMLGYGWPGNVRELRHLCGYLQAVAWGRSVIRFLDLPPEHRQPEGNEVSRTISPFDRDLAAFERGRLVKALSESKGSVSGAARLLGMSRNTVSRRMRKYGLMRQSFEV